jgi:hypothetical protein
MMFEGVVVVEVNVNSIEYDDVPFGRFLLTVIVCGPVNGPASDVLTPWTSGKGLETEALVAELAPGSVHVPPASIVVGLSPSNVISGVESITTTVRDT